MTGEHWSDVLAPTLLPGAVAWFRRQASPEAAWERVPELEWRISFIAACAALGGGTRFVVWDRHADDLGDAAYDLARAATLLRSLGRGVDAIDRAVLQAYPSLPFRAGARRASGSGALLRRAVDAHLARLLKPGQQNESADAE